MVKLILSYLSVTFISITALSQLTFAVSTNHLVINEVQTNGLGTGTTSEEFIEIHNPTTTATDISNWSLRYVSSSGSLLTAKNVVMFPVGTIIYPQGNIVVLPQSYLPALSQGFRYALGSFSGLSFDGASVDLINQDGDLVDRVGWGDKPTTILCEALCASAPPKGESIQRKLDDNVVVDTDNNLIDFEINLSSTPNIINIAPPPPPVLEDPIDTSLPDNTNPSSDTQNPNTPPQDVNPSVIDPNPNPVALLPIQLTELMIDPATPLSDTYDEWVELYNPNSSPVNLEGYSVLAGLTGSYKYIFENQTVEAKSYIKISSKDTPITLSNSASKVVLKNDSGVILDEVIYENAETGNTYAKDALGKWLWTTTPTPLAINVITYPVQISNSTTKKAAATAKKLTPTKVAAVKKGTTTKSPTSKAVKKAKATNVKGTSSSFENKPLIPAPSPVPTVVLAITGGLAILYCCYEYRYEVRNKFRQFRLYRENRSKNRA